MRNRLFLLLSSSILVFSSVGADKATAELLSFKSTPLNLDNVATIMEVSGKASTTQSLLVHVYVVNDLYPDGIEIANLTFKENKTETFSYHNEYTRTTNRIKIGWKQSKVIKENSAIFNIELSRSQNVRLNSSVYTHESRTNVITFVPNVGVERKKQKIIFYNFEDRYMPDFYHKIDLSTFKIKNESEYPSELNYKSAFFSISSINNSFSTFGNLKRLQLPIKLLKSNGELSLAFQNKLFVNPITLEMSPKQSSGFVETKYFYLPRDSKQFEESYECTIKISCFGLDNDDFILTFRYKSLLNIFGDCRNSQYCIANT